MLLVIKTQMLPYKVPWNNRTGNTVQIWNTNFADDNSTVVSSIHILIQHDLTIQPYFIYENTVTRHVSPEMLPSPGVFKFVPKLLKTSHSNITFIKANQIRYIRQYVCILQKEIVCTEWFHIQRSRKSRVNTKCHIEILNKSTENNFTIS
jgi:hypothetical protein